MLALCLGPGTAGLGGCQRGSDAGGTGAIAATAGPLRPCTSAVASARQALFGTGRAVVTLAVADLLERPDADSPLADQALLGEQLKLKPTPTGACILPAAAWVEVETEAGYHGFVEVASLRAWPSAEGTPPYRSGDRARVTARFANVYAQPDLTRHNPILVPPLGVELRRLGTVIGDGSRWLEVALPDGRHGFVQRGDVQLVSDAAPAKDAPESGFSVACVLAQSLAHEGTPYLWGGRSTYGIDCSGLVSNVFAACGVVPPRDAHLQYAWSALKPVERAIEALQPGDLLFFGPPMGPPDGGAPTESELAGARITHVGVHLGDGRFVHATVSERPSVHQSQLRDGDWQRKWIGARRHPGLRP